ncbi:MAG: penicillin-binding protein 1C [Nitrospirae bacterium]|nr:penicillin-binding protein 1C [Nitrospirota bacterium]
MKTLTALFLLFFASSGYALPSFDEVRTSYRKSDAVLLDRHGKVIHELRVDPRGRRLDWAALRDVSPALVKAVVHAEDRRFYDHAGVDWKAVVSVAVKNLFSSSPRGASTITMQLASFLDKTLKPKGSARKTFLQKWDQIKDAREIEKRWTKAEILDAYLNLVTFRGELQGIGAAARGLFDKEPGGLDEPESLVLAALIPSPNTDGEHVSAKACAIGASLRSVTPCEVIRSVALRALQGNYPIRQRTALAPHVAYALLKKGKASVTTTLDGGLQRFAAETLRRQIIAVRSKNVNDGAVLVVENRTGDVLAYVGGAGDDSRTRYVDGIQARRQAGSTLKPFLYALAFEKRLLTPASIVDDSPLEVPTPTGIYKPEDYENDFKGMVSARTALASSLNVPAVRTLSLVGVDVFVQRLRQSGFDTLERADYYGPSLALGSADVTLWELVNAYRTLANRGLWGEMDLLSGRGRKTHRRVFTGSAAFLVSDILSDREARSATFSLENPLATRYWSAVKTGTSKDMRDNWCIGYSEKYTVGVWVGNFSGEPMWNVSGITGAAPVWLEVMNYLHRGGSDAGPLPPSGILSVKVEFPDTGEPARKEWFLRGTEPPGAISSHAPVSLVRGGAGPRITYPPDGTIIALDPDIPEGYQRIYFDAETGGEYRWTLDGEMIGKTDGDVFWEPRQGRHVLSLTDRNRQVIDSVTFEVRGSYAGLRR